MTTRANDGLEALTEKEKQTLRLMVRGHDAKSIARSLDLSVHTINERLRDARRKMAVSSSREAARLLLEAEDERSWPVPDNHGDRQLGEASGSAGADERGAPLGGVAWPTGRVLLIAGGLLMTVVLALLALTGSPVGVAPEQAAVEVPASDPQVVDAARHFLELGDQARWEDGYRGTGAAFRSLNSAQVWAEVSQRVRTPLGAVVTRTFHSQQNLPAPPSGYEVVKFRTRFANKASAIETVTLDREDGAWRVVGVTVE